MGVETSDAGRQPIRRSAGCPTRRSVPVRIHELMIINVDLIQGRAEDPTMASDPLPDPLPDLQPEQTGADHAPTHAPTHLLLPSRTTPRFCLP